MIGPGEPNALNSGLGIAAQYIAEELGQQVSLTVIQPGANGGSKKMRSIDSSKFSETAVIRELVKVNVRASISPYFYAYVNTPEEDAQPDSIVSEIKNELASFTKQVVKASQGVDFDVIYAHDWTAMPAGIEIKESSGKPLAVHIHSLDYDRNSSLNKSWIYTLEKEAFEKADAVIGVSDYTSDIIRREYDATPAKVHTVYNGLKLFPKPASKNVFKEKLVLFVGRLSGQKGPDIFVEIAEKVLERYSKVRFVMAGEGDMLANLVQSAALKGIGDKFHFTGHIDAEKLGELYSRATIYCMPSVSEPFGLSAIEAAAAGLPVVLSRQSGAAEILSGSLSADHWDVDTFASHIVSLLKSDKKATQMVKANRKDLSMLTWEHTAQDVVNLLNSLNA